jgi:hypothetical protein
MVLHVSGRIVKEVLTHAPDDLRQLDLRAGHGAVRRRGMTARGLSITEADLQQAIVDLAQRLGLRTYHTYDSRRSDPGFPDLVIAGRGGVLFRELKSATGRVTKDQQGWLELLTGNGMDAGLWRPSALQDGLVLRDLRRIKTFPGGRS